METVIHRDRLLPVLSRIVGVVERRQTLPILGNLLVRAEEGRLEALGTDLEVQVRASCEAKVLSAGEVTVPARKLTDIVRNLPEDSEVTLKGSGERLVVTSGRGRYVLGTLPAAEFPVLGMDESVETLETSDAGLKRLLDKTAFAMAQQDVRYYLNGLLLEVSREGMRGVSTDGHRLARLDLVGELTVTEARSVIVPFKTVMELRKQLSGGSARVSIRLAEKMVEFSLGDVVMISKLVDGRYPDYDRVIPVELSRRAVVDKEGLRAALSRAAVLSNEKYRGVRLAFESGNLKLQAHNPEQEEAVEEMELAYEGDTIEIGFNVGYVGDVLSAVESDTLEVLFEDGNSSSIWRGEGCPDETFVVMPMRL